VEKPYFFSQQMKKAPAACCFMQELGLSVLQQMQRTPSTFNIFFFEKAQTYFFYFLIFEKEGLRGSNIQFRIFFNFRHPRRLA
jgi:hypothetical protein